MWMTHYLGYYKNKYYTTMTSRSNEDILKRVQRIVEFYEAGTWPDRYKESYNGQGYRHINPESFNYNENMLNFTRELCNLLEKYNVNLHSVTGGLYSFSIPNSSGTEDYLGVDNLPKFLWSEEEMDKYTEGERKYKEEHTATYSKEEVEDTEDDSESLYIYTAGATFTADVDMTLENVNLKEGSDIEECLCDLAFDQFERDDLEAMWEDDVVVFKNLSYEKLNNTTYHLKLKDLRFSTGIEVEGSCVDSCNDDRWSVFSDKVDVIPYLINIRDEYVSEVD